MRVFIVGVYLILSAFSCKKTVGIVTPIPEVVQPNTQPNGTVHFTNADQSFLLQKASITFESSLKNSLDNITVDSTQVFQTIEGFGYTLTGGSADLLAKMSATAQDQLLKELFSKTATHISYLRLSVGASDLSAQAFTYADGGLEPDMKGFSLAPDQATLIPVLKKILAINPDIKIMATPWSAPAFMKTNGSLKGGSLKTEYYGLYADYLIKYIAEMAQSGIKIDALTIQNEPENPHNLPSMLMTAVEQADFIKNHLGPKFVAKQVKTKILTFDHNCDHPQYPIAILDDPAAKKYIDGSAFHLYAGDISAMGNVHNAHPDKNVYFTEQWTGSKGEFAGDLFWHTKNVIIGSMRNWAATALEWNLANDPNFGPHTDGGCTECKGALTINGDAVTKNVSFYIIAHASSFVPPGSVRIGSTLSSSLPNVAFKTPNDHKVLIVMNESTESKAFNIAHGSKKAAVNLSPKTVATYIW